MNLCSEGCGRKAWARGYCASHYQRARASGALEAAPRIRNIKGAGAINGQGYRYLTIDGVRVREHIVVAEAALGRKLPPGAQVHHVNMDRSDNRGANLVVCPSQAYHQILHLRTEALDASGHADWRRCAFCKQFDAPANLAFASSGKTNASPKVYHLECRAAHRRDEYSRKRAA